MSELTLTVFALVLSVNLMAILVKCDIQDEALQSHNTYRRQHHTPDLELRDDMINQAQRWADHLAETDEFEPQPDTQYGENIYATSGSIANGAEPVSVWYSGIDSYDFSQPHYSDATGTFTQVIWYDSSYLGFACASNAFNTYCVANYDRPGNIEGVFRENVLPKF